MFLLLPVITSLRGIDLMQLPGYLADGASRTFSLRCPVIAVRRQRTVQPCVPVAAHAAC